MAKKKKGGGGGSRLYNPLRVVNRIENKEVYYKSEPRGYLCSGMQIKN